MEALRECMHHLSEGGIIAMQFGEIDYDGKPNRTARFVSTAREAFRREGIEDFEKHVLVSSTTEMFTVSTILLRDEAFTDVEVERFIEHTAKLEGAKARHAWGKNLEHGPVNDIITVRSEYLSNWYAGYPYDMRPVNGFFSVTGSVLATIVSMTFGFDLLLLLGLISYGIGLLAIRRVVQQSPIEAVT